MKTITMSIDALGQVTADDLKMGRVGEHKNTRLLVQVDAGFAEGIDYYRMSFGGFETNELHAVNGLLSYDVPCAATGSTVKSWQLTGYKAGEEEPELVRKSQMRIFTLEPSVTAQAVLSEEYADSLENDILRAKAVIAELESLRDTFVAREAGKGLSTNDYTDADKAVVDAASEHQYALSTGKTVYQAEDGVLIGGTVHDLADGSGQYVGSLVPGNAVELTVTANGSGKRRVDIYYITFLDRELCLSVNGVLQQTVACPGNLTDWNATVGVVSTELELQEGENILRLDNPNGNAPNVEHIEIETGAVEFSKEDKNKLDSLSHLMKGRIETSNELNGLKDDGIYTVSVDLAKQLSGYNHPLLLIVLKESGSGDYPGVPAQYLLGGPKTLYRARNLNNSAWRLWTDVATLQPAS